MKNMILPNGTSLNPTTPIVDVFVYGTLKVGRELAGGLDQWRLSCEEATCKGVLYRGKNYPMMVKSAQAVDVVHGEVHRYPMQVLPTLDMIEGYHASCPNKSLFIREKIPVYIAGRPHPYSQDMFAYIWKRKIEPFHYPIYTGEWVGDANIILFEGNSYETGDLT